MRRATPPGGSIFARCPCRRKRGQLRAKSSTRKRGPKTAGTPPGDAAMQLSSEDINDLTDMLKQCGLLAMAACEDASEANAKKARTGPYGCPKKTPREIAKLANPALVARLANSVNILQDAVKSGGDGSLDETIPGDPEALRGLSPPPPTTKPSSSCATSPEPARRATRSHRHSQRHRHTEPAQCTDERLKFPREHTQSITSARPKVFRKPSLWKVLICLFLITSSPGSTLRSDATPHSYPVSGAPVLEPRHGTAPGGRSDDCLRCAVPKQSCSEHASAHMSSNSMETHPSQRGRQDAYKQEGEVTWCKLQVPGTHMPTTHYLSMMPMSDMKCDQLTGRQGLSHIVRKAHARHAFIYI